MAGDLTSGAELAKQWSLPEEPPSEKDNTVEEKPIQPLSETPTEQTADPPSSEKTSEGGHIEQVDETTPTVEEIKTEEKSGEISATEETTETSNEEPVEEKEDTEEKPEIKLETAPADFRFPTTNQTRHCFTRYIEYHRCIQAKGEDAPECNKFAKYYRSLCPTEWVERWNEQRENGTFPGPL